MHPIQSEEFEKIREFEGLVHVGRIPDREFIEAAREEFYPAYQRPRDWAHADPFDVGPLHLASKAKLAHFLLRGKSSQALKPSPLYEQSELERTFHANAEKWRKETGMFASIAQRAMHPSYLRIIGLGRQAIPLLLEELRERPDHWFWALRAVAGEDPVVAGSDFDEAVEAWLRWGREHGYAG